jgi:hypothetical protein
VLAQHAPDHRKGLSMPAHASPPDPVVALPFTMADHAAIAEFQCRMRTQVVHARLALDHEIYPERLLFYRPYRVPSHDDAAWIVFRAGDGVQLEDAEAGPVGERTTIAAALAAIQAVIATERRWAIAAIPRPTAMRLPEPFA